MKTTEFGIMAKGRNELLLHELGKRLTFRQMCLAMCYDCMGGYTDGKYSCEIFDCPIFPKMPYRNRKESGGCTENDGVQELNG